MYTSHDDVAEALDFSASLAIPAKLLSFENMWIFLTYSGVAVFVEDFRGRPLQKLPHFSCLVSASGFSSDEVLLVATHSTVCSELVHEARLNGVDKVEKFTVDIV